MKCHEAGNLTNPFDISRNTDEIMQKIMIKYIIFWNVCMSAKTQKVLY